MTRPTARRVRRTWLLTTSVVIASVALAGCGSTSSKPVSPPKRTDSTATTESSSKAKPFRVIQQGWSSSIGTDSSTMYVHWVAVIENPYTDKYGVYPNLSIVVKDSKGQLLAMEEQRLNALPPGARIAFSSQIDLSGGKPATVEVSYKGVEWHDTKTKPADYPEFAANGLKVSRVPHSGYKVVGTLTNPYNKEVSQLASTALFYDGAGKLVGGATSFPSDLPAKGSMPFQVQEFTNDIPKTVKTVKVITVPWSDAEEWNHLASGDS